MAGERERTRDPYKTAAIVPSEHPGSSNAQLVFVAGPGTGTQFTLGGSRLVDIGRLPECDLTIDSDSVSRHHAIIQKTDSAFRIIDRGSTNGTLVNDVKLAGPTDLVDGDIIRIGKAVIKFIAGGSPEAMYLENLVQLSAIDPLTGAANRRSFDERLAVEVQKLPFGGGSLGLLLLDVDYFKRINDGFGHPAGDAVLVRFVNVVRALVPSTCVLARVGGEEFAVIYPGANAASALALAEAARAAVEGTRFEHGGRPISVTVSVGVAAGRSDTAKRPEDLYATADQRLYAAKAGGRNRVCGESP